MAMEVPPLGPCADEPGADLESYDEDEEYDAREQQPQSDAFNSALAVGYKSDRSFVVRGDRIGVFRHTDADGLGKLRPVLL
jgi:hypothetical protein